MDPITPCGGLPLAIAKAGALAVTEVDCDSLPPAPEHCNMYETVPAVAGVTATEPLVGSPPDQSLSLGLADAVHAVEFELDQVSVADCPSVIAEAEVDNVTVGLGGGGGVAEAPPHPKWAAANKAAMKTPSTRVQRFGDI